MRSLQMALQASVCMAALVLATSARAQEVPAIDRGGATPAGLTVPRMVARPTPQASDVNMVPPAGTSDNAAAAAEEAEARRARDSVPRSMPPRIPALGADGPLSRNASVAVREASRWANRAVNPRVGDDGRIHLPFGRAEPVVVCAVLHWCDIALQPGETILSPGNLGDPRWVAHPSISGSGVQRVTHIAVKPSDAGLDANLVLQTNRRTYSIRLISRRREYMPLVTFDYPDDEVVAPAGVPARYDGRTVTAAGSAPLRSAPSPCDSYPTIPPSFYRIGSGDPTWRPVSVYAVSTPVGMKTCVQFPDAVVSTALPVLIAISERGGWFSSDTYAAVNMRYETTAHRYMVDGYIREFDLVRGVGSSSQRVKVSQGG